MPNKDWYKSYYRHTCDKCMEKCNFTRNKINIHFQLNFSSVIQGMIGYLASILFNVRSEQWNEIHPYVNALNFRKKTSCTKAFMIELLCRAFLSFFIVIEKPHLILLFCNQRPLKIWEIILCNKMLLLKFECWVSIEQISRKRFKGQKFTNPTINYIKFIWL